MLPLLTIIIYITIINQLLSQEYSIIDPLDFSTLVPPLYNHDHHHITMIHNMFTNDAYNNLSISISST